MITVTQEPDGWLATCSDCAWRFRQRKHVPTMHKCKVTGQTVVYKPPGWETRDKSVPPEQITPPIKPQLGTSVEDLLKSYDITPEWWTGFKEKFGLPPTCGCKKRKDWLNAASDAHPTIANFGVKLLDALKRKAA